MRIILVVIIVILLILSGIGVYIAVSGETGPIPSDDGYDDNGDDNPNVALSIINPGSNPYYVPETGCTHGKYYSILVEVQIYGTEANRVNNMAFEWVNVDYGKTVLGSGTSKWDKIDEYNIKVYENVLIQRLGKGTHTLKITAGRNNDKLSDITLDVVIPDHWVYYWDSRDPVDTDYEWNDKDYFYGFEFPYETNEETNSEAWLSGWILRVKGQIYTIHDNCDDKTVYFYIWDGVSGKWKTIKEDVPSACNGWSTAFDIDVLAEHGSYAWGNEIGFSTPQGETCDGFVGEIWIEPGTVVNNVNPLEFLMSFLNGDSQSNPPYIGR